MIIFSSIWIWISSVLWPSYELSAPLLDGNSTKFHVIGAGLSRTGTFSTRIALAKLLGGKCYHGFVGSMEDEPEFWLKAAYGKLSDEEWRSFLTGQGYTAGVGEPISLFFDDLMRVYPEAKVILTRRPAEKWYDSMRKAIIEPRSFLEKPPISWVFDYYGIVHAKHVMEEVRIKAAQNRNLQWNSWSAVEAGKETAVEFFEEWNQLIVDSVPKDRLLVFDAREGWEPLCNFLGLPVPDEPFPRINDSLTIQFIYIGGYCLVTVVPALLLLMAVYYKSKRFRELVHPLLRVLAYVIDPILNCWRTRCYRRVAYKKVKRTNSE